AYVAKSKFKEKMVSLESDQYELTNGTDTIGINTSTDTDRTTVKTIVVKQKTKEVQNEGVANVTITSKGDTTLTKEWVSTTLTFTSGKTKLNFDIGYNDIEKGLN